MSHKTFFSFFCIAIISYATFSQNKPKVNWNITTEIWARYSNFNNGTKINNQDDKKYADISIRRFRIPISYQLSPKVFAFAMIGGNNYNFGSGDSNIDILDAYAEYDFHKSFEVGMGKSGWQGLNRFNVFSSSSILGYDAPLFSLYSLDKLDDIGRYYGVWAKGQIHKFDYRLTFSNPLMVTIAPTTGSVDYANNAPKIKSSGYVKYQFFEHESNKTSYQVGTYITNKKIFNIGTGFAYQPDAMANGNINNSNTKLYDIKHWAVDSFLSLPFKNKETITAYTSYNNYNFGPNYIRNVSANTKFATGGDDFNGAGNGFPMIGTGETLYGQVGYAFNPVKIGTENITLQPCISWQHSNWEALNEPMNLREYTLNLFLDGHEDKISLGYQSRPIFDKTTLLEKDRKGMAVLQYQITIK